MLLSPTGRTTPLDQKATIRIVNRCPWKNQLTLTEGNFDEMMERADTLSRQRLQQPLGPFWLISFEPELPYDTPYSGWTSLRTVLCAAGRV